MGWMCRSLFEHMDRRRFCVHLYMLADKGWLERDQAWFVAHADSSWRTLDWTEMAERIRLDRIDLLLDLDSASVDLAALVVAQRPAARIATWLGWDASGIPAVDFYIADSISCPKEHGSEYREQVVHLECFAAVPDFDIGAGSVSRQSLGIPEDAVVFYSGQTPYKRNPSNFLDQLSIVASARNGFLVLKGWHQPSSVSWVQSCLESVGLPLSRIRFLDWEPCADTHRANLSIADIVLDTFPYNGVTTTAEALWCGVPVVTQCGSQFTSRSGAALVDDYGLASLVATSREEYIDIGVRLGSDCHAREELRAHCASLKASGYERRAEFSRRMQELWLDLIESEVKT